MPTNVGAFSGRCRTAEEILSDVRSCPAGRRACPELACTTWQQFLSEYPYMDSGRINFTFRRFRQRLQEHRNNETVRRVLHQASKVAG